MKEVTVIYLAIGWALLVGGLMPIAIVIIFDRLPKGFRAVRRLLAQMIEDLPRLLKF